MKKIYLLLFIIPFFLLFIFLTNNIQAGASLEETMDIVNELTPDAANIYHQYSFRMPINSEAVVPTDYIIITMTNFEDIDVSQATVKGNFTGIANITTVGNIVKISGVNIRPGNKFIIDSIYARNPIDSKLSESTIVISENSSGTLIKNIGYTHSVLYGGSISVSATIIPPVAALRISGYTAPGTFVTITKSGTVLGTSIASINGYFSKYLTGIEPDTHNLSIYGVDLAGKTTSILDYEIYTPIYQETTVSNLLLSPTITIDTNSITQGEELGVNGTAIPEGDISIFTEPRLRTYTTQSDDEGLWYYTIDDTDEYIPGDYHIYSLVQNSSAIQSIFSNALQFTVVSESGGGAPVCDISQSDLNCDESVNLLDFSILMYYWGSTSANADINTDEIVNLTDFSIMMYYWGS